MFVVALLLIALQFVKQVIWEDQALEMLLNGIRVKEAEI